MKLFLRTSIIFLATICSVLPAFSQTEGDFRTASGGCWSDLSVWEVYAGGDWRGSEKLPDLNDGMINVQQGHNIVLDAYKTLDELNIEGSLTIPKEIVLSLAGNINVSGDLSVDGALLCGTNTVYGSGAFFLNQEATLQIGSEYGITISGKQGNIQTYNRLYSYAANYVYSGFAPQVTGNGLPAPRLDGTLTVDNRSGCSLTKNIVINKQLILSEGVLCLNGNTLTLKNDEIVFRSEGSLSLCGGTVEGSISPLQRNSN